MTNLEEGSCFQGQNDRALELEAEGFRLHISKCPFPPHPHFLPPPLPPPTHSPQDFQKLTAIALSHNWVVWSSFGDNFWFIIIDY